jgi:hypothetical protein
LTKYIKADIVLSSKTEKQFKKELRQMLDIKISGHASSQASDRHLKKQSLLNIILELKQADFNEFVNSKYTYACLRDRQKKESLVIAVNNSTITIVTVINKVMRCNDYPDTIIINVK